jgi:hypothetical protein
MDDMTNETIPQHTLEGLRRAAGEAVTSAADAFDLVRKTVTVGAATVPIANLRALWIIGRMSEKLNPDDPASLLAILWVLFNQNDDAVLCAVDNPPGFEQLSELAAKIDLVNLPDYMEALELMFSLVRGKPPLPGEGGCPCHCG